MNSKVAEWLLGPDTGASSKMIVRYMEGLPIAKTFTDYPRDSGDIGRCIRLMDIEPTYRARISEMRAMGHQWKMLVEHWSELESLYRAGKDAELFDLIYLLTTGAPYPRAELEAFRAREAAEDDCPTCDGCGGIEKPCPRCGK